MFKHKDLLGLRDLKSDEIEYILDTADSLKKRVSRPSERGAELSVCSCATLFYEDSTRTKMSFLMAAEYMGAKIDDLGVATSSVNKGESLADTGANLDHMGINLLIMRHRSSGAASLLARHVRAGVINAGDGTNEHPTQALLDLFTIKERLGGFKNLKVVILGDVNHSRVARSNVFGLTKLGAKVTLAGPSTLINKAMAGLAENVTVTDDVKAAVSGADAVMGLRVQKERQAAAAFPDLREYTRFYGITPEVLSYAKQDALIMHPGPVNRGVEMNDGVLSLPRSTVYEQAGNGVVVRMAILKILFERSIIREEARNI